MNAGEPIALHAVVRRTDPALDPESPGSEALMWSEP